MGRGWKLLDLFGHLGRNGRHLCLRLGDVW